MQQIHILLVDDNEGDILLTREALEEARIINKISIAHDGMEAIDFLRRTPPFGDSDIPDLILLDINLPGMSGLEALAALRADAATAHIPVVAITANAMAGDVSRGQIGRAHV